MHAELTESSEEARSFRIRINVFGENLRHTMSFGRKNVFARANVNLVSFVA